MHVLHMPRSDLSFIRLRRMPLSLGRGLPVPFRSRGTLDNTRLYFYYSFDYSKEKNDLQYTNIHKICLGFILFPVGFPYMEGKMPVLRSCNCAERKLAPRTEVCPPRWLLTSSVSFASPKRRESSLSPLLVAFRWKPTSLGFPSGNAEGGRRARFQWRGR